jgi:hypothetical protein
MCLASTIPLCQKKMLDLRTESLPLAPVETVLHTAILVDGRAQIMTRAAALLYVVAVYLATLLLIDATKRHPRWKWWCY